MKNEVYKVLLIVNFDHSYDRLSYYDDWVKALVEHKKLKIKLINFIELKSEKNEYDFIFLHHSTNADSIKPLQEIQKYLQDRKEEILIFIGNEFNNIFSPIGDRRKILRRLNISYVGSMLMHDAAQYLWSDIARKKVILTPPALNNNNFFSHQFLHNRKYDIGFKGIKYYSYIGDTERNDMVQKFSKLKGLNLSIDNTRYDAKNWSIFLNSCKSVISSEAGSYYVDIDDKIVRQIILEITQKTKKIIIPRTNIDKYFYKLPLIIKKIFKFFLTKTPISHSNLVFEDAEFSLFYEKYFKKIKKPSIHFKCISSRNFDAIGTKTAQILLEGKYNDILEPNVHYIELKKDYSNFSEVIEKIKDKKLLDKITKAAHDFIFENHLYRHRVDNILDELTK